MGRALELTLTGRPVEAEEALRIGLVNEVVPPGSHVERALELAEQLAGFPAGDDARRPARHDRGRRPAAAGGPRARARLGREVMDVAARGAARFAGGEGRGGTGF